MRGQYIYFTCIGEVEVYIEISILFPYSETDSRFRGNDGRVKVLL